MVILVVRYFNFFFLDFIRMLFVGLLIILVWFFVFLNKWEMLFSLCYFKYLKGWRGYEYLKYFVGIWK